jgi:hypothetical protein
MWCAALGNGAWRGFNAEGINPFRLSLDRRRQDQLFDRWSDAMFPAALRAHACHKYVP